MRLLIDRVQVLVLQMQLADKRPMLKTEMKPADVIAQPVKERAS
jgi:hypothetical protein